MTNLFAAITADQEVLIGKVRPLLEDVSVIVVGLTLAELFAEYLLQHPPEVHEVLIKLHLETAKEMLEVKGGKT